MLVSNLETLMIRHQMPFPSLPSHVSLTKSFHAVMGFLATRLEGARSVLWYCVCDVM